MRHETWQTLRRVPTQAKDATAGIGTRRVLWPRPKWHWVWDYKAHDGMPNLGVGLPMDKMDPLCVDHPMATTYRFDEWIEQKELPDPI